MKTVQLSGRLGARRRGLVLALLLAPWSPSAEYTIAQTTNTTPLQLFAVPLHAFDVAFSPDGAKALVGGAYGKAILFDLATGQEAAVFQGLNAQSEDRTAVAFTTNGNYVLTAQADHRSAVLWRATNQAIYRAFTVTLATVPGLSDAAVAPDASKVATCDRGVDAVRVWEVGSGRQLMVLMGHPLGAVATAFSPDGRKLLTGGNPVASVAPVRVWDLMTWQTLFSLNHQSAVTSVSFSSDGSKILTVDRERQTGEGMALLWNATTGARIRSFPHGNVQVLAAASAPDDSTIVTGAADGQARRFNAATGELLQVFRLGTNSSAIPGVAFAPDGNRILTAHADGWAAVWSLAAGPAVSLSIDREPGGQLVVTWPAGPDTMGAVLQQCLDVSDNRWTDVTPSQPGRYEVTPRPGACCFFRLLLSP